VACSTGTWPCCIAALSSQTPSASDVSVSVVYQHIQTRRQLAMSSSPRGCWVVMVSLSCRLISQTSTSSVNPFSSWTGSQSNWQSYSMTYSSLRRRPESCEGVCARVSESAWAAATAKTAADQQAQTTHMARGIAAVAASRPA